MVTQTPTIDVQVHSYERNRPERPWNAFLEGPDEVTGDDMVAAMDAVGVNGALLISPFRLYGYDASYALEVYAKHPGRFGLIKPVENVATTTPKPEQFQSKDVVSTRNRRKVRGATPIPIASA